jgi:hypothetical protein
MHDSSGDSNATREPQGFDAIVHHFMDEELTGPTQGAALALAEEWRGARLRDAEGNGFDLKDGLTCIGRSPYRAVQLDDLEVSRKHAEIVRRGNHYVIRDMTSPNGTYVNGFLIQGEVTLWDGDQVTVGQTTLTFERSDVAHSNAM